MKSIFAVRDLITVYVASSQISPQHHRGLITLRKLAWPKRLPMSPKDPLTNTSEYITTLSCPKISAPLSCIPNRVVPILYRRMRRYPPRFLVGTR